MPVKVQFTEEEFNELMEAIDYFLGVFPGESQGTLKDARAKIVEARYGRMPR